MRQQRNIAFVPIRKGSKGVQGKNTKLLNGKPLMFWILDTLVSENSFQEIWLATDCDTARKMTIERYGEKVNVYMRSENSATDSSSIMVVLKEFVSWRQLNDNDWLCLFQTTSPFTTHDDIVSLLNIIKQGDCNSIVTCVRQKMFRWTENAEPQDYNFNYKPRRQEYNGFLVESGNFYATTVRNIIINPYILSDKATIVEVSPNYAIDIDEPRDWATAEYMAQNIAK